MTWLVTLVRVLAALLAELLPPVLREMRRRKDTHQYGGDPDLKAAIDADINRVNKENTLPDDPGPRA